MSKGNERGEGRKRGKEEREKSRGEMSIESTQQCVTQSSRGWVY